MVTATEGYVETQTGRLRTEAQADLAEAMLRTHKDHMFFVMWIVGTGVAGVVLPSWRYSDEGQPVRKPERTVASVPLPTYLPIGVLGCLALADQAHVDGEVPDTGPGPVP